MFFKSKMKERFPQRPFALFMGPQRSATSWIDRYLRRRGDVCLPAQVKETFFFDRRYKRGLNFYRSHFKAGPSHVLMAEVTTTLFDYEHAPRRVYEMFGEDITLICPLRHPIVRSYSLYRHNLRYGLSFGSLEQACRDDPRILNSSRYAQNLQRWYEFFPKDSIHLVFQEALECAKDVFISDLCCLLGLPFQSACPTTAPKYNTSSSAPFAPLAAASQKGADWLRSYRLYFLINTAKKFGVKGLVFGREKRDAVKLEALMEAYRFLEEQLTGEVEALESLIGSVTPWDAERYAPEECNERKQQSV